MGNMANLKIEYIAVGKLTPYGKNTRKHGKRDVGNIARSIEKYGMNDAIGIWGEKNIIVDGHGRWLACKQLGISEVPCVRLDHLSDDERREYGIAHNATAELSEWDAEFLESELSDLDLGDFDFDFGIDASVLPGGDEFDENDLEKQDEKMGGVLVQITFKTLQEYKTVEQELKNVAGESTMTVKMV